MACSRTPTDRSTSSSVVVKQKKQQIVAIKCKGDRPSQHRNSTTPVLVRVPHHFLQERPLGAHTRPRTYPLVVNPIVDGVFLHKTLVDGDNSMNNIFTKTLRKMDSDFSKMTA
jgi:hypothetical protein